MNAPHKTGTGRRAIPAAADLDALIRAEHRDPFSILGPHGDGGSGQYVRAYLPAALSVRLLAKDDGRELGEMEMSEVPGFFVGHLEQPQPYLLKIQWAGGEQITEDPYSFGPLLGEMDLYLFAEGNHRDLSSCLGAQVTNVDGVDGVRFAVWAPNARRVSVVGSFNSWDGRRHPMRLRHPTGVWEIFVPRLQPGEVYKYEILGAHGILPLKSDPMALATTLPPDTASKVSAPLQFEWSDQEWLQSRTGRHDVAAPLSIYELHAGSWQMEQHEDGQWRQYNWRELADRLIPYVKELGFTHIELMPIMEHPFGGSWGYQLLAQFAPTARYGSPEDFAAFVDACHRAEIGVILDWVPAHFPTDTHGLAQFDGTALYEYADPKEGFHQDWNTLIYNLGRTEVHGFMLASALHWLKHYHIDGLRVDAVASMLYRDYSRNAGEWVPNRFGGRENLEAIDFLRHLNDVVALEAPGTMVIAEESTAWPGVSEPTQQGGLGFNYKWNMGWMHDSLQYMEEDPINRGHHHGKLSFGLVYAWSERFVLPISHDEVVHGKHSLIDKMPGDHWQKFANLRAYLSFMWTHPGKKLLFMGCEFGQWREWNHDRELDWYLMKYAEHIGVKKLVSDLNRIYRQEKALHQRDADPAGFQWLIGDDQANSVFAYLRWSNDGEPLLVVANMTPVPRLDYRVGAPVSGAWTELLNSDAETYAGSNMGNGGEVNTEDEPAHGMEASLKLNLPPLAVLILKPKKD
ncbi:glycogen branching protein [Pseudomonas amygdali pv. tabaci str. ATCC 11528]|uniref:1,4-alpha-glucan branching enzyme GlgB n=3 Tax=Pseudomonas syringae group genomosp. 2 TaxID=251698 RepID=A0AAX1VSX2_PSEAJ|nr:MULTISPECIES: 1,4-alpha-glucan branching protein GlgB [Pseudomonas syringae group genomosp. 2]KPX74292.1 1,4-alpha-glucan branching enzyme GlgB [Pseudomonas amygdali pv. lachrymans]KEZ27094.1 glycogen branching protein [Pseudomonas amygdali pv. tabaci str. 6605]KKY51106.1 glycogen branching protein [Pseudomonas amygdali pv. tabaci str. ATCC 11528]KPY77295.1 1,4-alpha-glucan branching enzyme GlgB [Pseudomonas amygdali pv. tabaci]QED84636.1 1,4-alpha-glucan branching protein GlgB [Pseudomonas